MGTKEVYWWNRGRECCQKKKKREKVGGGTLRRVLNYPTVTANFEEWKR